MTRVVVTGIAGFIGSNLAERLLRDGYSVTGIDNLSYGLRSRIPESAEFIEQDIRDPQLRKTFEGAHAVFHLAAKNCIPDCQDDPVETASINVFGTVNVFEAARQAGVKKVVYAESSALYEGSAALPSAEKSIAPQSFYAISKLAGMEFAEGYKRYFGMKLTALRYFCVYGPHQDYRRNVPPLMSAFIMKLLKGEPPIIYGSGEKRRDFIYIDDVSDFHMMCLTDPRTDGRTFNLGTSINYSVRQIYEKLAQMLDAPIPPVYQPDQPGEALETLADISAARSLGWRPNISLDEGLRRSIAFIRKYVI